MSGRAGPRRMWGDDFQLRDLLDEQPGSLELATRDFALLTVTARLASVKVAGALLQSADIQVEVSYREAVVEEPLTCFIGEPFYEPFAILVMQPHEIAYSRVGGRA